MKKLLNGFVSAVPAGMAVALGGTVFLRLKGAFPGSDVIGAVLFALGLFAVCTRGYHLFTGKACYIFDNKPDYLLYLVVVWLGNFVGALLTAGLEMMTGICGEAGINVTAATMIEAKMTSPYLSLFVLGFFCNIFIYLGVNGYAKNPHEFGKYLAILLSIPCFILCGTEHSVAGMYYWAISGRLFTDFGASILCLLVISIGNIVGGVFLPLVEKLMKKTEE